MADYDSSLFVSIVLYTIYVLLAVAVGVMVWSAVRGFLTKDKEDFNSNGIPQRRIAISAVALLVGVMSATWLFASTKPLNINGTLFSDTFWLRTSDMLLITPLVLVIVMVVVSVVAVIRKAKERHDYV